MRLFAVFLFLVISCVAPQDEFEQWQDKSIAKFLAEDKANKELELMYLEEIGRAQENNDSDALDFFFQEYMDVPRLDVPDHLKSDPRYFEGGYRIKY